MSKPKLLLCVHLVFDDSCWAKLITLDELKEGLIPDHFHVLIPSTAQTVTIERHGDEPYTYIWGETEPGSALEDFNYHEGTRVLINGKEVFNDLKPVDQAEHDEAYEGTVCDLCPVNT